MNYVLAAGRWMLAKWATASMSTYLAIGLAVTISGLVVRDRHMQGIIDDCRALELMEIRYAKLSEKFAIELERDRDTEIEIIKGVSHPCGSVTLGELLDYRAETE